MKVQAKERGWKLYISKDFDSIPKIKRRLRWHQWTVNSHLWRTMGTEVLLAGGKVQIKISIFKKVNQVKFFKLYAKEIRWIPGKNIRTQKVGKYLGIKQIIIRTQYRFMKFNPFWIYSIFYGNCIYHSGWGEYSVWQVLCEALF